MALMGIFPKNPSSKPRNLRIKSNANIIEEEKKYSAEASKIVLQPKYQSDERAKEQEQA